MGLKNTGRKCEPISFAAHRDERSEADKKRLQHLRADDHIRDLIANSDFDVSYSDYLRAKKMRSGKL